MDFSLADTHTMLAMPVHRDLPPETVMSLLATQGFAQKHNVSLSLMMTNGTSLIHHGRTQIANDFLKSDCTHLFWVDSDIVWEPQDFFKLVALGTKLECVCASYPVKSDKLEFFVAYFARQFRRNEYGCVPIRGAGIGFTVVQRKVIEQLAGKATKLSIGGSEPQPSIFRCDAFEGEGRGEDHAFFADVRELGYEVNLYPTIKLGHVGRKVFRASVWEAISTVK